LGRLDQGRGCRFRVDCRGQPSGCGRPGVVSRQGLLRGR